MSRSVPCRAAGPARKGPLSAWSPEPSKSGAGLWTLRAVTAPGDRQARAAPARSPSRPGPSPGGTAPALGKASADCLRFHLHIAWPAHAAHSACEIPPDPAEIAGAIQAPALTAGAPPHLRTRLQAPSKEGQEVIFRACDLQLGSGCQRRANSADVDTRPSQSCTARSAENCTPPTLSPASSGADGPRAAHRRSGSGWH
jgi:hypothetical protein